MCRYIPAGCGQSVSAVSPCVGGKIVGGCPVARGELPWLCSLHNRGDHSLRSGLNPDLLVTS